MAWPDAVHWTVAACGAGTLLLRWLPLVWRRRGAAVPSSKASAWLAAFTAAIGPAALGALLATSLWPLATGGPVAILAVCAGASAVVMAWRLRPGVVWPMLVGAAVYGLLLAGAVRLPPL